MAPKRPWGRDRCGPIEDCFNFRLEEFNVLWSVYRIILALASFLRFFIHCPQIEWTSRDPFEALNESTRDFRVLYEDDSRTYSLEELFSSYSFPLRFSSCFGLLAHPTINSMARESDLENGDGRTIAIGCALCGSKAVSVLQSKSRRAPSTLHGRDRLCWFLIVVWIIIAAPDICTFSYISEGSEGC